MKGNNNLVLTETLGMHTFIHFIRTQDYTCTIIALLTQDHLHFWGLIASTSLPELHPPFEESHNLLASTAQGMQIIGQIGKIFRLGRDEPLWYLTSLISGLAWDCKGEQKVVYKDLAEDITRIKT